ncbi:MAG TPA: iron-containing alcohol dehydrogenase, partial [Ktedonobacteraceae bacterium]|nr:iron-containing alcohol dehydrogenase [Ktedonobacteraceae bacterium]
MKNASTFAVDPGNIPALKRWLAKQGDQSTLRPINIDEILIGKDALLQLPQLLQREGLAPGARTLLVMDKTPMLRETQDLKLFVQALLRDAGYQVRPLWLERDHYGLVHADFTQVRRVRDTILPGDALVALGSGTVTDIVKHAAHLCDLERDDRKKLVYICCLTANSVTAFAANMAVLLKDGVKRTIPSRYPTAIIADLPVLASAPKAMTLA